MLRYPDDKKEINKSHIIEKARERAEKFQKQVDATKDNNEKDSIYQQGIKETSHPSIMGNYANFLYGVKKDYDVAEKHFHKAIEIEPEMLISMEIMLVFYFLLVTITLLKNTCNSHGIM